MTASLESIYLRLSNMEKKILLVLCRSNSSLSIENIRDALEDYSETEIINGLNSLKNRFLIFQEPNNHKMFDVSPLLRAYIKLHQTDP